MLKKLFRIFFTLVGALIGYGAYHLGVYLIHLGYNGSGETFTETQLAITAVVFVIIFSLFFYRITPAIGRHSKKVAKNIESELQAVPNNDLILGTAGLIVGLLIAFLVSQVYVGIRIAYLPTILTVATYLILGYIGVVVATKKVADLSNILPPKKSSGKGKGKSTEATPKIFDTSVIIDGRIAEIMKTGFIEGPIIIPEFVLLELQHIADSSDNLKRNRGRRGLDILKKIQTEYSVEIRDTSKEKGVVEIPEVDIKLLKLAQIMDGKVVTNDYNLNKVASIQDVGVLNINELANTLKPAVLPGEEMRLFLVKEGKESKQAVAYLDDGTMIVVEDGKKYIGQNINAMVTSVLQTSAGRMIFAKSAINGKK